MDPRQQKKIVEALIVAAAEPVSSSPCAVPVRSSMAA